MAADPFVDRADVQAGRAPDAAQRRTSDGIGEHLGATVVDQHHVHFLRPVAGSDAAPQRVYGFIRSPVDDRGNSRVNTSRSAKVGSTFSMPTTLIRVSGRVRHIRPLPSDSTTTSDPVSAIAKFAPEMPTLARRNFSRRCRRAAPASSAERVGDVGGRRRTVLPHLAKEDLAHLGAVAVDRRHQDVARAVMPQLDDQLGQVGLPGGEAGFLEGLVEVDLLGSHRLDLDTSSTPLARTSPITIWLASAASRAQWTVAPLRVSDSSS